MKKGIILIMNLQELTTEFEKVYFTKIEPKLRSLEEERIKVKNNVILLLIIVVLLIGLACLLYSVKLNELLIILDIIFISFILFVISCKIKNFIEKLKFALMRYANSYTVSSTSVLSSDDESLPTIKIWVNWGRDQVKVLNTLIQDSFTPQNNVNVLVEQVNATLVQGVISGNSPDLYLHMARTEPVNLAMRGVLYDLKNSKISKHLLLSIKVVDSSFCSFSNISDDF